MFAITAIAVSRVSGEPEFFLLQALLPGTQAQLDPAAAKVVYSRHDLVDFLEAFGKVVVLRAGLAPHPVRVRYGTHGYRFIESFEADQATDALRRAPRFAFVNEATADDLRRLGDVEHGDVASGDAPQLRRLVDLGWLRLEHGRPALTDVGRALLSQR